MTKLTKTVPSITDHQLTTPLLANDYPTQQQPPSPSPPPSAKITDETSHSSDNSSNSSTTSSCSSPTTPSSETSRLRPSATISASTSTSFMRNFNTSNSILKKALILLTCGTILGILLPKNPNLPTPRYRTISSIIGYTYFLSWSISFYPQVITNRQRRSTVGLSNDFTILNVVGFACYSMYSAFLFWDEDVKEEYRRRNGGEANTVQSNDVAFAFHAFVLSCVVMGQVFYFRAPNQHSDDDNDNDDDGDNGGGGGRCRNSTSILTLFHPMTKRFLILISLSSITFATLVYRGAYNLEFLDFLYFLSSIKLTITIVKYIPQVLMNYRRKSTDGWNVWNVLLDFSGGTLSTLQLVLDCVDMGDWNGILGNWTKFGLGFVSIVFDVVFMLQHYVLYSNSNSRRGSLSRSRPGSSCSNTSGGHCLEEEQLMNNITQV